MRRGDEITPVEVKSGRAPRRPWDSHVLQLAAYCLLVEEALGARVTQGILCYSDKQFVIPYTPALKSALLNTLTEMRNALSAGKPIATTTKQRAALTAGFASRATSG